MKILDYLTAKPARFFLLAALIWGGLMCYLNYKDGVNFKWHDLLVEANGMVFDLLVFGILLSVYEALREKKEKIERLHEEIDDYRGWDEKEAMYRIVGAIKRLNMVGVSEINLSGCFLYVAILDGINLSGSHFTWANLTGATLIEANLSGAYLFEANLTGVNFPRANLTRAQLLGTNLTRAILYEANLTWANLPGANLTEAILTRANLTEANLYEANLSGAKLAEANLMGANLTGANLIDADVGEKWLEKLKKWKVVGQEEIAKKYLIDKNGRLQQK